MKFVPEIIYIGLVAIYSFVITRSIPKRYYSFSNILIALGALVYAFLIGLNPEQLGFNLQAMKQSTLIGIGLCIPIIVVILILASHKRLRSHFSNTPAKQYNLRAFCYEIFFRVPFGTAWSEEIIFRSVLLALLLSNHGTTTAIVVSSILFGLWHIFPTLHTAKSHDPLIEIMDDTRKRNWLAVGTSIIATTLAGLAFALLTTATGSFFAAWLLHSAINGFAVLGGYIAVWLKHRKHS